MSACGNMPMQSPHVRCRGINGPNSDAARGLKMDPTATSGSPRLSYLKAQLPCQTTGTCCEIISHSQIVAGP